MKIPKWLKILCDGFITVIVVILTIIPIAFLYSDITSGTATTPRVILCIIGILFFGFALFTCIYGIIHPEQIDEVGEMRKYEERLKKPVWRLVFDFIRTSIGCGLVFYIVDAVFDEINDKSIIYYAVEGFLISGVIYGSMVVYYFHYKNKNKNSE